MQAVCIRPDNSLRRAMVQVETSVEWEMKEAKGRKKDRERQAARERKGLHESPPFEPRIGTMETG